MKLIWLIIMIWIAFFKNNLINLILLNDRNFKNNLDLVYINAKLNFSIKTYQVGSVNILVDGIIAQKSIMYENYKNGFVAYNIISYNLNNRWVSENNFKLGYSYENIIVEDNFSGIVNKKEEALIIRPKVFFLNVTNSVDVELNNYCIF